MKPFFTFYGGKWRTAPRYPAPKHKTIIEPFAGSAGYSLRYPELEVILVDLDPVIAGTWDYLIHVSSAEIRNLPDIVAGQTVDELEVIQEARWLIGWWLNKGASGPRKSPSTWMRGGTRPNSYWGSVIRERIASQVDGIRHWRIIDGSYIRAPDCEATYFVDPPYQDAGKHYRESQVDYEHLAGWCRSRNGQVLVCENEGADWLPFEPFLEIKSNPSSRGKGKSKEAIWTRCRIETPT